MRKKLSVTGIMAITLGVILIMTSLAGCSPASTNESKGTVVYADASWDSIQVHNRIAAFILKSGYGYEAEYVPGDTIPLFAGLSRGDVDVDMEVWVENQQEAYDKAIADKSVIDLGGNFLDNWQGWLVPTYFIKGDSARGIKPVAPDIKSVEDMGKYWELFKDPESPGKGRFHNGTAGWEATTINGKKLEAYGLDKYFTDFLTGSDAALSGSMAAAYEKGQPWFGYYWAPTWIMGKYDMTPLEEPPFNEEAWKTTRACAYPSNKVNIAVNADFAEEAPEVVGFLSKYETNTEMVNKVLAYMQSNKASTDDAAMWFLKEYEEVWTKWVPEDIAGKVKSALP